MTKLTSIIEDFSNSVSRLREVLGEKKSIIIRDAAIKRFELVFDLSWKAVKTFLEEKKGLICKSPTDCYRQAYKVGLIGFDDFWVDELIKKRNLTVHTYDEGVAEEVYNSLPEALRRFQELSIALRGEDKT